ncbi:fructose-1,6-bisphosphatase II [Arthrobacter sp. JUb119]|uniref:class II fructose-bisphosphatase n=1 Tax=Arthrobacter sp. JUb115 TaxID=2485108 RepID=UPI00105DB754|nr:class II fructose-bisphosphatase [Arthrobacter sp. JUb115]MCS3494424.1 fructose-1,6-bisphosphatase II [Arthrobacter sp. JUb119]TDU22517.1 fructose-1,6-bisphosphatase II [Arthrobacter sp. JUb115]
MTIASPASSSKPHKDRNLALELVRATEAAAIAATPWVGAGDKNSADGAAVDAMRLQLATVNFDGVVVIGEGEKDQAPMLYNGERVGNGTGQKFDVAVDPIDGTRLAALGFNNALSVLAVADAGSMLDASSVFYMEKLVTGPEAADDVDLRLPVKENLRLIAKAKGLSISQLTVSVLDRDRHQDLVREIHEAGARTQAVIDGDVAAAIAAVRGNTGIDALMGIGGSPEGVVTACAIKALGGVIQGRLMPTSPEEQDRGLHAGLDMEKIYSTNDLVNSENCFFAATGITNGDLLKGVTVDSAKLTTQSIVMRSKTGTVRTIDAEHKITKWSQD